MNPRPRPFRIRGRCPACHCPEAVGRPDGGCRAPLDGNPQPLQPAEPLCPETAPAQLEAPTTPPTPPTPLPNKPSNVSCTEARSPPSPHTLSHSTPLGSRVRAGAGARAPRLCRAFTAPAAIRATAGRP